jgi:multimeric flavodoxin WrbA
MKKVVIISSTLRRGGNSEILAEEFANGATDAGNEVEVINIKDLNLKFCIGCMYCQDHERCVLDDDMNDLLAKVQTANVLVFATPIYYYAVSGQLKTFLDRLNPLYPRNNKFEEVYLLATCADAQKSALNGAIKDIEGWISCFDGVRLKGVLYGTNVTDVGDIQKTDKPQQAYEMGNNV